MTFSLLDLIPLSGAFVALLILVSIVFRSGEASLPDYLLLIFLVVCLLSLVLSVIDHTGYIQHVAYLLRINHVLGLLRPPLFFLYIYFAIHPTPRYSALHGLHFIPTLVLILYLRPFFLLPAETKWLFYLSPASNNVGQIPSWYYYFGLAYSILYLIASVYVFHVAREKKGYLRPEVKKWFLWLLLAYITFILGAFVRIILHLGSDWDYLAYYILTLFLIAACLILLNNRINLISGAYRNKYVNLVSPTIKAETLLKLTHVMQSEKLYRNDRLRLRDVAQKINVQDYLLSQIINEETGKTFTDYINQLRVQEAKIQLTSSSSSNLTIEAIGSEAGFNSKASFYAAFRKHTGLTPREFQKKVSK